MKWSPSLSFSPTFFRKLEWVKQTDICLEFRLHNVEQSIILVVRLWIWLRGNVGQSWDIDETIPNLDNGGYNVNVDAVYDDDDYYLLL